MLFENSGGIPGLTVDGVRQNAGVAVNEGVSVAKRLLARVDFPDDAFGTQEGSLNIVTVNGIEPSSGTSGPHRHFEIRDRDELWLKQGGVFNHERVDIGGISHAPDYVIKLRHSGVPTAAQDLTFTFTVNDVDEAPVLDLDPRGETPRQLPSRTEQAFDTGIILRASDPVLR